MSLIFLFCLFIIVSFELISYFYLKIHKCSKGTDRSSIFVAMCILVQQLRLEKRVDIRVITQKLRTQRAQMIDSVNAYEFLHRALVDFANLHKSSFENSPS